jgi:hypothetical protein
MGNRFATMPGYKGLIRAHGTIAAVAFLFLVPIAIMSARFHRGRLQGEGVRFHIYLQVLTLGLATVVLILGWIAVGPARSLTNPHHGIGLAIYVLVLVQFLGGWWIHGSVKRQRYRITIKRTLHQWLGMAIALLGIVQVPLGLTLYGSPKFLFIIYTLWMVFLLVVYFILNYRQSIAVPGGAIREDYHEESVIGEKRKGIFGGWLGPLAAGAGAAALLSRNRNRSRSRNRSHRDEVIPSRRGSVSYVEEKHEERRGGRWMERALEVGALVGAAGLAKSWYDRRQRKKEEAEYSSVAHDTPSRHRHGHQDSVLSDESERISRVEHGRRSNLLPGPGDPVVAAAAMSAAERPTGPVTPHRSHLGRTDSFDSGSYSYSYDSTVSPSHRPQSTHKVRDTVLAGLGIGWFAKKMKDRRDKKEEDRLDRLEEERIEEQRIARQRSSARPPRFTGDGLGSPRRQRHRESRTHDSEFSSVLDDPHEIRPGAIPPIPAGLAGAAGGAMAAAAMSQSRSKQDVTERVNMPPIPPDPQGVLHQESGSEQYFSSGGAQHRRHSSVRRREGEEAAAAAAAGAAGLAAEEEARRRRRSRSRAESQGAPDPVSVKVKMHGDKDQNVTLRRLTEQEAAAEREVRRGSRSRRRADSASSLSGTDTAASRRRYRREDRQRRDEVAAEQSVTGPPPAMALLSPPNPAFAGGRRSKESAYYSARPEASVAGSKLGSMASIGSPESHGTWSAMSPGSAGGEDAAAERRRRRRLERNQRPAGTVDFT